jgi:hypothetical protein
MQIPACRQDPVQGAQVNVSGTINVFESVKKLVSEGVLTKPPMIVYASRFDYHLL